MLIQSIFTAALLLWSLATISDIALVDYGFIITSIIVNFYAEMTASEKSEEKKDEPKD